MHNSLQRIILIDTHLKGLVELKLDQHTNINGINASGKTTLQRLVLVFYGALPNSVVPKSRHRFAKYYLPHQSSYIIYEYINPYHELCQVILASNDAETVSYRFVSKGFEPEDYIKKQQNEFIECYNLQELRNQFNQQNISCSNLMSPIEYRAIIQHDKRALFHLADSKKLRSYLRSYSLCQSPHNLRHLEKLLHAIHSKNGKMAAIKLMIEAILKEDGSIDTPTIKLKLNDVEKWAQESVAVEQLRSHEIKLNELVSLDAQLFDKELQLGRDYRYLSDNIESVRSIIDGLNFQDQQLKDEKQELSQKWDADRSELNNQIGENKSAQSRAETELKVIADQYNQFLKSNIEEVGRNLAKCPQWENKRDALEKDLKILTEKNQAAQHRATERKNEVLQNKDRDSNLARKNEKNLVDERSLLLEKQRQEIESKNHLFQQELETFKESYSKTIQLENHQLSNLKAQFEHCYFTQEEQAEQLIFTDRLAECNNKKEQLSQDKDTATQQLNNAKKQRDLSEKNYFDSKRKLEECKNKQEQARLLYSPRKDSLLQFLRTEKPDWTNTIAKVIDLRLLKREDLKPQLLDNNDNLFGLNLDLEQIAIPPEAQSEKELLNQLRQAEELTGQAQTKLNETEKNLAEANKHVKRAEQNEMIAQSQLNEIKARFKAIQEEQNLVLKQHQQNVTDRKQLLKQQIQQLKIKIAEIKQQHQNQLTQYKDIHTQHIIQIKAGHQQALTEINNKLNEITKNIQQIEQLAGKKLQDIDRDYQNELAGQGINIQSIQTIKAEIADLIEQINKTQSRRNEHTDYQDFKRIKWEIRKPELDSIVHNAQKKILELDNSLKEKERHYKTGLAELNEQQKQISASKAKYKQQIDSIDQVIHMIKERDIVIATHAVVLIEKISLDEYIRNSSQRCKDINTQRKLVNNKFTELDALIYVKGGNKLAEAYEKERNAITVADDLHQKIMALKNTFALLPQFLIGIRDEGRNYGKSIKDYYDILKDIDNKIIAQSAKITRHVNEELDLDDVSDSKVHISSKISTQDYWDELNKFKKLYAQWEEEGFITQPDTEYLQTMQEVAKFLGQGNYKELALLDLFEIELHIKEGKDFLRIRTDQELHDSSSHGMAYLILCKFLLGFTRMLRGNSPTFIHWPIDELGTLHVDYIAKVFRACEHNRIIIVGALPNPDLSILQFFKYRYWLDKKSKTLATIAPFVDKLAEAILAKQITGGFTHGK